MFVYVVFWPMYQSEKRIALGVCSILVPVFASA
ncbi:hypothetical protein TELCIR_21024 [Teladorsagia circumcincta]|uniref:Uncharacterized protein n=2 Tax=Teladorsagia circumcincta TaxID=45464 RepID=A0A2G9TJ60_TELCI|nr:hypothetical protein TELCIR_21024 [Teladorsagia circumcincta]